VSFQPGDLGFDNRDHPRSAGHLSSSQRRVEPLLADSGQTEAPSFRSALDQLDPDSAFVLRDVLATYDPHLLAALEAFDAPTRELRERVTDVVADAFSEHVAGPDRRPTAWGKRVYDALGWFLYRFPIES
jgi:hypothetical protein